jgi:hypothetical protein
MIEIAHRPLRERENVLASDVADAIEMLIARDLLSGLGLPTAIKRSDVVDMLIEIAHTDDDGTVVQIFPMHRRALGDVYHNRLTNTGVFQAGYKRYERRSSNPVCPVTDFFFKVVFANGVVADCLDAMSDHEIKQSLPKRTSIAREEDGTTLITDGDGTVVQAGEVAGVVVFPPNMQARLLAYWLERRTKGTVGSMQKTTLAIEHARPGTAAIEHLKESTRGVPSAMRQALPKPRTRGT